MPMAVASDTAAQLVHQIFDLQRAVRCVAMANSRGQTGPALQGVLRFVGERESRAAQLAARLGVSPPVLSRHIAELEELGLVMRRPDPEDGRAQLVALTSAGRSKLREIEEQRARVLQGYLRDWSEADADAAARTLEKLADSLRSSARATEAGRTTITTTD
jgi:DNA-binding MarR family transcriptional regulator